MFFSVWGAGLAKYRWTTNTPGFVLSNAWNLRHKRDLRIYDAPEFIENPTPLVFVDVACVTDRGDLEPLVRVVGGQDPSSYANFDVSLDAVGPQIDALLDSMVSRRLRIAPDMLP
jgi:hypothetical protein